MLKSELYRTRRRWYSQEEAYSFGLAAAAGYYPYCAICKRPFTRDEAEMHEVIITRGHVRGRDDLKLKIMVRYNCVLVHPKCHQMASTKDGKRKCISHLLVHEDAREIAAWLGRMQPLMSRSNTPEIALNLVIEVLNENLSELSEELRAAFATGRDTVPS